MEITDIDNLTNEEYDAKRKVELKIYKADEVRFSSNDLRSLVTYVLNPENVKDKSLERILLDWKNTTFNKKKKP